MPCATPSDNISRRSPNRDRLPKPVPIINSVDGWRVIDAKRVNDTHRCQTVNADARLPVDVKDFFLTIDLVGAVTGGAVVINEETVQAGSKDEDVARVCDMQAPRGLLSASERWVFPFRKRSVERAWRWRVWLEIRRLCLRKAEIMIRCPGEVVIDEDVVL